MQGSYLNKNTTTSNGYKQYVVKQDDSLYKIAKNNNTTVDALIQVNHLPSNTIYPNQILFIPLSSYSSTTSNTSNTYLTKEGESIKEILEKFNITFEELCSNNDVEKLKLCSNQLLYVSKTYSDCLTIRGNLSVEDVLSKYNLSPLELLKLNEDRLLSDGNEIRIR